MQKFAMTQETVNILIAIFGFLGAIIVAWFTTQAKFRAEVELNKKKIEDLEKRLENLSIKSTKEIQDATQEINALNGKIENYEKQVEHAMEAFHKAASSLGHGLADKFPDLLKGLRSFAGKRDSLKHLKETDEND
jgi:chromosome segregation ATPase